MEERTDFTKALQPARFRSLPFQGFSRATALSMEGWRSARLSLPSERGRPKYLRGKLKVAAGKFARADSRLMPSQRIGAIELFATLVIRPETSPKLWRMLARADTSCSVGVKKMAASS